MMSVSLNNLNNVAISKIKNGNYRCITTGINKRKATQLLWTIDFAEIIKHY